MNYNWNWAILIEALFRLAGVRTRLDPAGLRALGWIIAFSLGSLIGVIRTLPSKPLRLFGMAYVGGLPQYSAAGADVPVVLRDAGTRWEDVGIG